MSYLFICLQEVSLHINLFQIGSLCTGIFAEKAIMGLAYPNQIGGWLDGNVSIFNMTIFI